MFVPMRSRGRESRGSGLLWPRPCGEGGLTRGCIRGLACFCLRSPHSRRSALLPHRRARWNAGRARTVAVYGPAEVLVRFAPGVDARERAQTVRERFARVQRTLPRGMAVVGLAPGDSVARAARELEREPDILDATPNFRRTLAARTPNDPRWPERARRVPAEAEIDARVL